MKYLILCLSVLFGQSSVSQSISFDLLTLMPPKGWKMDNKKESLVFSTINAKEKKWGKIVVFKSTKSSGDALQDFNNDWASLVKPQFKVSQRAPQPEAGAENGWKIYSAADTFPWQGQTSILILTTYTKDDIMFTILASMNGQRYLTDLEQFIGNIKINNSTKEIAPTTPPAPSGQFAFTTTNFDDGWSATALADYVEVKKGAMIVRVHYPHNAADQYHSVLRDGLVNAWNILVTPRYSNIRQLQFKPIQSYESIAFAEADGIETATGKTVHIVLFKKHYSNGNGRYIEFVSPDKQQFEAVFGPYRNEEFGWEALANMQFRNRFAVAATDLNGQWGSGTYASLQYYYVNSGRSAGATATSLADQYQFNADGSYSSDHSGASGQVGNQKFSRQVYKGKATVSNWSISLTNRFEGATEKYDAYFEAIRGGRLLILTDRLGTVWTLVKSR